MKFSYSGNVTNRDTKMNIFESIKRNTFRLVERALTLGGASALEGAAALGGAQDLGGALALEGAPALGRAPYLGVTQALEGAPALEGVLALREPWLCREL